MPDKVSNNWLAKLFSLEFLASMVVSIFVLGAVWSNLNAGVARAQEASEINKVSMMEVQGDIGDIKTDIAVIKANQDNQSSLAKEQAAELSGQRDDIKKILLLLGKIRSKELADE